MKKDNQQHIRQDADTFSLGAGLSIYSKSDTKNVITVTNNKARYFSNLAKKYRDDAKFHCENAKHYAEENSNVTYDQLIDLRNLLEAEINTKQDAGDYALSQDIPTNVSDLVNDSEYMTNNEVDELVDSVLPGQEYNAGRFLCTDGTNVSWVKVPRERMFGIRTFDHCLSFEESKGYALQGTYVYKESAPERYGYPNFYEKCLEEKNAGVETQTKLGSSTITTYNNANGHVFYNIEDKAIVDSYFSASGSADMFGIDEDNQRVFLPRVNHGELIEKYQNGKFGYRVYSDGYCEQWGVVTGDTAATTPPNLTATVTFLKTFKNTKYHKEIVPLCDFAWNVPLQKANSIFATDSATLYFYRVSNATYGQDRNLEYSWKISGYLAEGQCKPVSRYSYYVVGNTEQEGAITDIIEVTTSENDTIPLFTGLYFDFTPNNVSWLKAGQQANSAGIYTTCYNTLVSCLSETNIYNLKVIDMSEMESGVDYSEYWKVNQEEMYFITPTKLSYGMINPTVDKIPVAGNGKTLGLTDGTNNYGMAALLNYNYFSGRTELYGKPVGTAPSSTSSSPTNSYGVTTDYSKSGLVANISSVKSSTANLYFKVANAVQNLELLDAAEILENCTTKSMVDGQWVSKSLTIATDMDFTASPQSFNISSYLPNDLYNYEVLVRGNTLTADTSGSYANLYVASDIIPEFTGVCGCKTRTSSSVTSLGGVLLPVGSQRIIRVGSNSVATGTFGLRLVGYRRVGTNI